jgi:hypothetical protein
MPDIGDGLYTAITSTIVGFVISLVAGVLFPSLAVFFNLLSIVVGIASLQSTKYWGILYSVGYFIGIALIGRFFMESWEFPLYLLIIGLYIFLKITRKL